MFSTDTLMDNHWAHLEEIPVEKSQCFYSCFSYPKINASFIVTYMYWNNFTFQTEFDGFTYTTPRGFSTNFFLMCRISFQFTWGLLPFQRGELRENQKRDGSIESTLLNIQTRRNPIGYENPLRYACSFSYISYISSSNILLASLWWKWAIFEIYKLDFQNKYLTSELFLQIWLGSTPVVLWNLWPIMIQVILHIHFSIILTFMKLSCHKWETALVNEKRDLATKDMEKVEVLNEFFVSVFTGSQDSYSSHPWSSHHWASRWELGE